MSAFALGANIQLTVDGLPPGAFVTLSITPPVADSSKNFTQTFGLVAGTSVQSRAFQVTKAGTWAYKWSATSFGVSVGEVSGTFDVNAPAPATLTATVALASP